MLLVDSISFLLHLPSVYRPPHADNECELWYFASRDISKPLSQARRTRLLMLSRCESISLVWK
jgi:hypothetical protein